MKDLDGVTLAKRLRADGGRLQIVFITGYPDFMAEGYDVSALHYLMKPVSEPKLAEVLEKAVERMQIAVRTVLLETPEGNLRLTVNEIVYAEVFSHIIELHTVSKTIRLSLPLTELEALLGDGFFRCHRSFVVGLKHVRSVTRKAMVLDTGVQLPLSRKLYDAANQAFIQY
jgi:DNA-binding LytR/AlgR family response regulator